jgi:hypothetical protein
VINIYHKVDGMNSVIYRIPYKKGKIDGLVELLINRKTLTPSVSGGMLNDYTLELNPTILNIDSIPIPDSPAIILPSWLRNPKINLTKNIDDSYILRIYFINGKAVPFEQYNIFFKNKVKPELTQHLDIGGSQPLVSMVSNYL